MPTIMEALCELCREKPGTERMGTVVLCRSCCDSIAQLQNASVQRDSVSNGTCEGSDLARAHKHQQKIAAISEITENLQQLRCALETEVKDTESFLSSSQEYYISTITTAFSSVSQVISARYCALQSLFDTLEAELRNSGLIPNPQFSSDTGKYLNYAAHFHRETTFLNLSAIVSKSISLKIEPAEFPSNVLNSLLADWNEAICVCEKCEKFRDLFALPSQQPWDCWNCKSSNAGSVICSKCFCGKQWVDYLSYSDVKMNGDQSAWVCDCGRNNGLVVSNCTQCRRDNKAILMGLQKRCEKSKTLLDILKRIF